MMEAPMYNLPEDFLSLPSPNFFTPNLASPGFLSTPGATSNFASSSYFSYVPGAKYTPLPPVEELATTFSSSSRISLAPPPAPLLRPQQKQQEQQQLFPEEQRRESFVTKQTFDGLILSCSENVRRFLGYDALSLYNTSTYELIHPDDLDKILQVHLKLIEGGQGTKLQATYRVLRKSGDYADIRSTFVAEGSSIACYSVDLCPAKPSPPVAFFCSEELVSSSASLSSPASSASLSSSSSQEQVSLGSIDCVRCELRAFEDPLQESDEEVLEEGVFPGAALLSHPSHSPALSPEYSPNRHSSECTSEGNSENEFEEDDKDETYHGGHSHPLKARSKPKAAKVSKATSSSSATAGRTRDGNPKRERRMRRPPFGESCGECHIFESTEWRKGPNPNRLLCNACGLRYTRKVKKEMKEKLTSQ